jgi:signal transduction histidine kinase
VSENAGASVNTAAAKPEHARMHARLSSFPLAARLLIASCVLAALVAGVFLLLVVAVSTLRDATEREAHAKDVVTSAVKTEKLVLDLETGLRGLQTAGLRGLRPGDTERILQTALRSRAEIPQRLLELEQEVSDDPTQLRRARQIRSTVEDYVQFYFNLIIDIARDSPEAASTDVALNEGRRRIDDIQKRFSAFTAAEDAQAARSAETASDRADTAIALGVLGLVISAALIILYGAYLARSIAAPVRGVAQGATRLAAGELSVRLGEGGPGEIGELTRAFNVMAGELERNQSELREQNRRLQKSERAKSELVSIVSHEVRTPLASVLGFTSLLLNRDTDEETRRRYLEIVDAQGRRLNALLDDFLDVQRLEEGRLKLSSELVDMAALLEEQVQLFEAQSELHRLELAVNGPPLDVRGDPNRLAQVVGNLLSNAIKYSPEGGTVEVLGEQSNGSIRVSVRDHGLGIPAEQHDRIFTKFFRGDAATSGIAGSGLGLAFARAVIEAHGGRMGFESASGTGSTFFLELPRART